MAAGLPQFPEFDLHPRETTPARFDRYVQRLERLFTAMAVDDPGRKQAMLLHYAGDNVDDIFQTLVLPPDEDPDHPTNVYAKTVKALKTHFEPQRNVDHLVYLFRKETQMTTENISQFHTRLQLMAKKCNFTDQNTEIKRQIIQGCTSSRLRRKAMESNLTLDELLRAAQAMEASEAQTAELEGRSVNAVHTRRDYSQSRDRFRSRGRSRERGRGRPRSKSHHKPSTTCGLCGGSYPHKRQCPAKGQRCHKCGTIDHFARVCRKSRRSSSRYVNAVDDHKEKETEETEEYTFCLATMTKVKDTRKRYAEVKIADQNTTVMLDTGSPVEIITERDYNRYKNKPALEETQIRIYPYLSQEPLKLYGKFRAKIECCGRTTDTTVYVAEGDADALLSCNTSEELGLVKTSTSPIHVASVSSTPKNQTNKEKPKSDGNRAVPIETILQEYDSVCSGVGMYKGVSNQDKYR